jgi:cytochrome oxidase Cu insertion factor (SCO1/SenC/PrrC family)
MRGFVIVAKVILIALLVEGLPVSSKQLLAQHPSHDPEDLAIGKVAPEIEGADVNGMPFKLSDYRGQVVLLDFWGDW